MPHRRPSALETPAAPSGRFHKRYDELENHRAALIARLAAIGEAGQRHPGYKGARKLLNGAFCKAKLPQRFAVLKAASWLIGVLEQLSMTI